jgi:hypothetical protein
MGAKAASRGSGQCLWPSSRGDQRGAPLCQNRNRRPRSGRLGQSALGRRRYLQTSHTKHHRDEASRPRPRTNRRTAPATAHSQSPRHRRRSSFCCPCGFIMRARYALTTQELHGA